jgi:hypothetical protein
MPTAGVGKVSYQYLGWVRAHGKKIPYQLLGLFRFCTTTRGRIDPVTISGKVTPYNIRWVGKGYIPTYAAVRI